MGDVISLARHRQAREAGATPHGQRPRTACYFDLASPATYLAAERVDRGFPGVLWRPALREALHAGDPFADAATGEREAEAAHARAHALRLPLVWPERPPTARAAMRVAHLARERGRAAPFVLAASRLAFAGGFDLEDPEILAEAAAAAGLGLDDAFAAAGDVARDGAMEEEGRRLLAAGASVLPAMRVGTLLFCGEDRLGEAEAAMRRLAAAPSGRHAG
jgi:2-hydroxychromene-2-carboxylate isomerase